LTIVTINRYLGGLIDLNYHIITCEKTTPNYLRVGASYKGDFLSHHVSQAHLLGEQKTGALAALIIMIHIN
jgi:hypothetical protein